MYDLPEAVIWGRFWSPPLSLAPLRFSSGLAGLFKNSSTILLLVLKREHSVNVIFLSPVVTFFVERGLSPSEQSLKKEGSVSSSCKRPLLPRHLLGPQKASQTRCTGQGHQAPRRGHTTLRQRTLSLSHTWWARGHRRAPSPRALALTGALSAVPAPRGPAPPSRPGTSWHRRGARGPGTPQLRKVPLCGLELDGPSGEQETSLPRDKTRLASGTIHLWLSPSGSSTHWPRPPEAAGSTLPCTGWGLTTQFSLSTHLARTWQPENQITVRVKEALQDE